jgi:hypothetical protein
LVGIILILLACAGIVMAVFFSQNKISQQGNADKALLDKLKGKWFQDDGLLAECYANECKYIKSGNISRITIENDYIVMHEPHEKWKMPKKQLQNMPSELLWVEEDVQIDDDLNFVKDYTYVVSGRITENFFNWKKTYYPVTILNLKGKWYQKSTDEPRVVDEVIVDRKPNKPSTQFKVVRTSKTYELVADGDNILMTGGSKIYKLTKHSDSSKPLVWTSNDNDHITWSRKDPKETDEEHSDMLFGRSKNTN